MVLSALQCCAICGALADGPRIDPRRAVERRQQKMSTLLSFARWTGDPKRVRITVHAFTAAPSPRISIGSKRPKSCVSPVHVMTYYVAQWEAVLTGAAPFQQMLTFFALAAVIGGCKMVTTLLIKLLAFTGFSSNSASAHRTIDSSRTVPPTMRTGHSSHTQSVK